MAWVRARVRRKDALMQKLSRLAPEAAKQLSEANRDSAHEMANAAKSFVPVRTGKLRDSIEVTPPGGVIPSFAQGSDGNLVPPGSYAVTAGNEGVRYAHLVEFGAPPHIAGGQFEGAQHPGSARQPFFWPAYRLAKRKHRNRANRALREATKKAVR